MSNVLTPSVQVEKARQTTPARTDPRVVPWLALVAEKVATMDFGVVQITVHDSKVVQIEHTERHRLDLSRIH